MADRVEEVLDVVSSGHSSESCLVNAKRRKAKLRVAQIKSRNGNLIRSFQKPTFFP